MARKRYTPEEIIQHLRTVELEQGKGLKLEQAAKKVGVTPQTIVRWRNEYGGMKVDQAKRLKELEKESFEVESLSLPKNMVDMDIERLPICSTMKVGALAKMPFTQFGARRACKFLRNSQNAEDFGLPMVLASGLASQMRTI